MKVVRFFLIIGCILVSTGSLFAETISYTDYFESTSMWMNNGWALETSSDMFYNYHYESDGMHIDGVISYVSGWKNILLRKSLDKAINGDFTAVVEYDWNNYTGASIPGIGYRSDITLLVSSPTTELFRAELINASGTDHGMLVVRTKESGTYDSTTPGELPVTGSGILTYIRVGDQLTLRSESGVLASEYTFTLPSDTEFTSIAIAFGGNNAGDFPEMTLKSFSLTAEFEDPQVVPEPATILLLVTGLVSFFVRRK